MSFIYVDDRFWLTAVEGRAHVKGADADDRRHGHRLQRRQRAARAADGRRARPGHRAPRPGDDRLVPRRVHARGIQPEGPEAWRKLLDSPNRVVFEVVPVAKPVSHDQRKIPGNGRGLAEEPDRSAGTRPKGKDA